MPKTEPIADLSNWRIHPHSVWGFTHVADLIPTQKIAADPERCLGLPAGPALDLGTVHVVNARMPQTAAALLAATNTDAFLVLHEGRVVAEHFGPENGPESRHIVFSVTKSFCGALAGILAEEGSLELARTIDTLIPELASSAWGDATIRQVLDMQVSVRFVEDYLDPVGDVARYRAAMGWNPPGAFGVGGGLHGFLQTLPKADHPHGHRFHYVSPNSDLLGWVFERATGSSVAELFSTRLWGPMGAGGHANITVDAFGAARTAGGLSASLRDLARFGEMLRCDGTAFGQQVVPADWINDILANGDQAAWSRGEFTGLFRKGHYRSKFYVPAEMPGTLMAIGIHGQWIVIDRANGMVAVRLASQPVPSDEKLDRDLMMMFAAIAHAVNH